MNATPENFKPGESWLCAFNKYGSVQIREVECLRWSESSDYVKVRYFYWDNESGERLADVGWMSEMPELLERLPDVESGNNQARPARRLETDSLVRFAKLFIVNWPCRCDHCKVQKAKAYTRTEEVEQDICANAETKDYRRD